MALTFGAVSSDRVEVASATELNNLSAWSMLFWCYPTTLTAFRHYFCRGSAGAGGYSCYIPGNDQAQIRLDVGRDGAVDDSYRTNNAGITTNKWWCVAATFDMNAAAGERINIYRGDLSTAVTECTYDVTDNGDGTLTDDASEILYLGQVGVGANSACWEGRLADMMYVNRVVTLAEVRSWQWRPRYLSGAVGFWRLGHNGTASQADYSGNFNPGTVTGATVSAHPALNNPWGGAHQHRYTMPADSSVGPPLLLGGVSPWR